jgi:hypothetical protein
MEVGGWRLEMGGRELEVRRRRVEGGNGKSERGGRWRLIFCYISLKRHEDRVFPNPFLLGGHWSIPPFKGGVGGCLSL